MRFPRRGTLIPVRSRGPLLAALVCQAAVYWGAKALTAGWRHYDMTTALDRAVPLLPWTVVIYGLAYLFWAANYIFVARQGGRQAFRLLAADLLGKLVCLAVFLLLPTANVRPEIPADAPFGGWLALLYAADTPEGLFPSLHCFNSWLCWTGVRGREDVPAGYRAFSLVFALAVALSTMTTKQHVLADVIGGLALGELSWQAAGRTGLSAWYERVWSGRPAAKRAERSSP